MVDDEVVFDVVVILFMVIWGIILGQGLGINEMVFSFDQLDLGECLIVEEVYCYMDFQLGIVIVGVFVDVCFIGSCINGCFSDLCVVVDVVCGCQVVEGIKVFVVFGLEQVVKVVEVEGLDVVFCVVGFEWWEFGCLMCLVMNLDWLEGCQISVSFSNCNFKGWQGLVSGWMLLMSFVMVVVVVVNGCVIDVCILIFMFVL